MTNYWGSREDLYDTRVTITGPDGSSVSFTADKMTNPETTSTETKFRPANGIAQQVSLGGQKSLSNITVSKLHDDGIQAVLSWLMDVSGQADMTITRQPLDANGAAQGVPLGFKGKLMDVKGPASDSESSAAAMVELIQSSVTRI